MILFPDIKKKKIFLNSRCTVDRGIEYMNFWNPLPFYFSKDLLLINLINLRCVTFFFLQNVFHLGDQLSQIIVPLNNFYLLHSLHYICSWFLFHLHLFQVIMSHWLVLAFKTCHISLFASWAVSPVVLMLCFLSLLHKGSSSKYYR